MGVLKPNKIIALAQFSNESKIGWINITFSSFFFHNQIQIECPQSVKKHISLKKIMKKIKVSPWKIFALYLYSEGKVESIKSWQCTMKIRYIIMSYIQPCFGSLFYLIQMSMKILLILWWALCLRVGDIFYATRF